MHVSSRAAALALAALVLGIASLSLTLASGPEAQTVLQRQAFVPLLASDDSEGGALILATATPTNTAPPTKTPSPTATPLGGTCAGDRSPVKTLSDAAANFGRAPSSSSVLALQSLVRPTVPGHSPRIAPTESSVVEVTGWLIGMSRGPGNGIDVLIANAPGAEAMVVAFPPQSCLSKATADDQAAMNVARNAFRRECGDPPATGMAVLTGKATFTGVPFWGPKHNDGKGAVSGIELHPVLGFAMADGSDPCDPNGLKTPTPTPTPAIVAEDIIVLTPPYQHPRGTTITVGLTTVPAATGYTCGIQIFDSALELMTPSPDAALVTDANGSAMWQLTIPQTAATGVARAQIDCGPGLVRAGQFFITEAQ